MFRLALAGALTLLSASHARTDDKKDPQAKFEPRSKPGEGQKFLEAFVGDWDVSKTFHPRTGEPAKVKGRAGLEDGGKRIVHRPSAIDDGKERLVMELVMTKKAEPKPAK